MESIQLISEKAFSKQESRSNFCCQHNEKVEFYCSAKNCGRILCNSCRKEHNCPNKKSQSVNEIDDFLLDNYHFCKFIGKGSYGSVFHVKSLWTLEEYALKVISNVSEKGLEIIKREIRIMSSLKHENIVNFSHCTYIRKLDILCIAMEICDGSLDLLIPFLNYSQAINYFEQICQGVYFLHEQQSPAIIHRDLKPGNILIKDGIVKLCDFGEAKMFSNDQITMTSCQGFGTPEYLAPEIFELMSVESKKKSYTKKADIWSLGIILHKMLSKDSHPFLKNVHYNQEGRIKRIFESIVSGEPKIDSSIKDKNISNIIKRCLEIKPEKRPDIKELLKMLEKEKREFKQKKNSKKKNQKNLSNLETSINAALLNTTNEYISTQSSLKNSKDEKNGVSETSNPKISFKDILTLSEHLDLVAAVSLSEDEKQLLSGSDDSTVILWDFQKGKKIQSIQLTSSVKSLCFSKSKKKLSFAYIATSENGVFEWDFSSVKELRNFALIEGEFIRSIDISNDGATLISGTMNDVIIWDISSGNQLKRFENHTKTVNCVMFSPDNARIGSCSDDKTIKLWQISTGKLLKSFIAHTNYVNSIDFSPDGNMLASGSHDHTAKVWDLSTGEIVVDLKVSSFVRSVRFFKDGNKLITGEHDSKIIVWEIPSGNILTTLEGHQYSVLNINISSDGSRIITGSLDETIKIWERVV